MANKPKTKQSKKTVGIKKPNPSEINPDSPTYGDAFHWAMNYINLEFQPAQLKSEAIKYIGDKNLNKLEAYHFIFVGKYAWLLNNGAVLKDGSMKYLEDKINNLKEEASKIAKDEKPEKKTNQETEKSVQDYVREQVGEYISEIEEVIDRFSEKFKTDFSMYNWLQKNQVKAPQTRQIAQYYQPFKDELDNVDNDKDLKEAYSCYTKTQLNKFRSFMTTLLEDCQRWADNQKKTRKPRKPKSKSANQIVKNMKYMEKAPQYKLVSVAPESIVGASQLWVFNTKYKDVAVYNAIDRGGLSVKGTTIQNFDPKTSKAKIARKPDEVLPVILDGGKVKLRKVLDKLTTKEKDVTGRINSDTILMRVIK